MEIKPYYQNEDIIIYNGDSELILPQLIQQKIKVSAVITDPPYILSNHGGVNSSLAKRTARVRDEIEWISNGFNTTDVLPYLIDICVVPNILMFCSNKQVLQLMNFFEDRSLNPTILVWQKSNPPPTAFNNHISDIQFVIYARGNGAFFNNEETIDIKRKCKILPIANAKKRLHPTQKPVKLIEEYVRLHCPQNEFVLDPFGGSGTTAVACLNYNRKCILIQKQEKYCEIAKQRIQQIIDDRENDLFKDL